MAKAFTIVSPQSSVSDTSFGVASGTSASIGQGVPTFGVDAAAASPWLGTVAVGSDGNGTTAQRFTGFAKSVSTETTTVAGLVTTYNPFPGLIYQGYAKTAANADTAAEVLALQGKRVVFDLTTGDWTVDAAAADAVANCVVITGGDYQTQTLTFVYRPDGTWLNFAISA